MLFKSLFVPVRGNFLPANYIASLVAWGPWVDARPTCQGRPRRRDTELQKV